jgi:sugar-phosphatase
VYVADVASRGESRTSAMELSAVLFDLDGVLVDSAASVELVWEEWAREHELSVEDVLASIHGRRARDIVPMFAPDLAVDDEIRRLAAAEIARIDEVKMAPGAHECIRVVAQMPWGVVTSGGRELASRRLDAVGLPIPEVFVTQDDVRAGKPDPEPYAYACRLLGVAPGECLVVEDSPAGVTAALRAGARVLAVTTTHAAPELGDADLVLPGLNEVADHLRRLIQRGASPPQKEDR